MPLKQTKYTLQVQGKLWETDLTAQSSYRLDRIPVTRRDREIAAPDFRIVESFRIWETTESIERLNKTDHFKMEITRLIDEEDWIEGEPG